MDDLINILHGGNHSLVVANGDICTFDQHGIADLYDLLCNDSGFLAGASIADKVVGKGAASLVILGHVAELHADIISETALEILNQNPVKFLTDKLCPTLLTVMVQAGVRWKLFAGIAKRLKNVYR